jgi:2-dehydro-3-deoxyphosphogluconate aldolase / (4S)-4-hydroxy-2-oxoglutarate aldolase
MHRDVSKQDSADAVLAKVCDNIVAALLKYRNDASAKTIRRVAEALSDAHRHKHRLEFFGVGNSAIDVMEITLRHSSGLAGIEAVARTVPGMHVGAGTVTRTHEMQQVRDAGAKFALSPGLTPQLHQAAKDTGMPFIPGAMTPSEVMRARDDGYSNIKLFPTSVACGEALIQALAGPLGDVRLCPNGGISPDNLANFLRLPSFAIVGGSWPTPIDLIESGQWMRITELAAQAIAIAHSVQP